MAKSERRRRQQAERAFVRELGEWLPSPSASSVEQFVTSEFTYLLDVYLTCRYAPDAVHARPRRAPGWRRKIDYTDGMRERFHMIEHGANREALAALLRLGGDAAAVFAFMWDEDGRIGPRGPEA